MGLFEKHKTPIYLCNILSIKVIGGGGGIKMPDNL